MDEEKRFATLYELFKLCKPVMNFIKENYGEDYQINLTFERIKIFKFEVDLIVEDGGKKLDDVPKVTKPVTDFVGETLKGGDSVVIDKDSVTADIKD